MIFKKLSLTIVSLLFIASFSGCFNLFSSSSTSEPTYTNEMDYLNTYVDELNKANDEFTSLQDDYESNVPLEVKADDEITFTATLAPEAETLTAEVKANLINNNLKIASSEKQTVLEQMLNDYLKKYTEYLTLYKEIGLYYGNQTYKTDLTKAAEYEKNIQGSALNVETKQQELFDKIEEYQKTSADRADINSTDPVEKMNAVLDVLTDDCDKLYEVYMDTWTVDSAPLVVKEKYEQLQADRDTQVNAMAAMDFNDVQVTPTKKYFDDNYLANVDLLLTDVKKLLDDYDLGLVDSDNIEAYDKVIQSDYAAIIDAHNNVISMSSEIVSK